MFLQKFYDESLPIDGIFSPFDQKTVTAYVKDIQPTGDMAITNISGNVDTSIRAIINEQYCSDRS